MLGMLCSSFFWLWSRFSVQGSNSHSVQSSVFIGFDEDMLVLSDFLQVFV